MGSLLSMRILSYRLSVSKDNSVLGGVERGDRVLDPLRLLGHDLTHRHLGLVKRLKAASDKSPEGLVLRRISKQKHDIKKGKKDGPKEGKKRDC